MAKTELNGTATASRRVHAARPPRWCVRRADVALLASMLRGNVPWLMLRVERQFYFHEAEV